MKTYTLQLRRIRYEQIEVTAPNEQDAYILAVENHGENRLMTNDRTELLSIKEKAQPERRYPQLHKEARA